MTIGFSDLDLSKELLKAVSDLGFEEPSPIQRLAIPPLLEGRDLVGQAQTGTGKTAAFGLPVLQKVNQRSKKTQTLILCPTRELAMQVAAELGSLAAHSRGISILPVYGGQPLDRQIRGLQRGVHVVVGTPGRVLDHLERGTLKISELEMLVLDEADEMLDMGFREDIERVLKAAPEDCQKVCFSATMPKPILDIVKTYMHEPEFVKITQKEITVTNIEQLYYEVRQHQKGLALSLVLDSQDFNKGIVFCSTKRGVDELTTQLLGRGYQADALHGNLSQGQRDRVMQRFRGGAVELLVATDVAARGLDIDDVDLVVNYDIPLDVENYVHRIGRTGRAGRSGKALTFVTPREGYKLRDITRYTKAQISKAELPTRKAINELKSERMMEEVRQNVAAHIKEVQESNKMDRFGLMLDPLFDAGLPPREVASALLKMVIEKEQGADEPEIEPIEAPRWERSERREGQNKWDRQRGERPYGAAAGPRGAKPRFPGPGKGKPAGPNRNMDRLFFNVGSKFHITPRDIVGAITGETGLPGRIIGGIEIYEKCTFVEVPQEHSAEIIRIMSKAQIRGAKVAVDIAKPQDK